MSSKAIEGQQMAYKSKLIMNKTKTTITFWDSRYCRKVVDIFFVYTENFKLFIVLYTSTHQTQQ